MIAAPLSPADRCDPLDLTEARLRRDLYVLASSLLVAPPVQPIIDVLTHADMVDALQALGLPDAASTFEDHARREPGSTAELDRAEYHALLAVPTGRYLTPFESVFCDDRQVGDKVVRGLLMGPSTRAVEVQYERAGFTLAGGELPDHVACEIGFLAELWRREITALESAETEAAAAWRAFRVSFIHQHAGRWIPALCDRLHKDTSSQLYAGLAQLVRGLLSQELHSSLP